MVSSHLWFYIPISIQLGQYLCDLLDLQAGPEDGPLHRRRVACSVGNGPLMTEAATAFHALDPYVADLALG